MPDAAPATPAPSKADKRYGGTIKDANVGGYIDKMTKEEAGNYDALRKKGLSAGESAYQATNPPGRVVPASTQGN
jgi:hypothetical protein